MELDTLEVSFASSGKCSLAQLIMFFKFFDCFSLNPFLLVSEYGRIAIVSEKRTVYFVISALETNYSVWLRNNKLDQGKEGAFQFLAYIDIYIYISCPFFS